MARFGVKEVANVTFYDLVTNEPVLFLDTLKMTDLENSAESVYATGGQGGTRLVGWDYGRTATFSIQDALLNPKAISMQLGTELRKGVAEIIHMREVIAGTLATSATDYEFTLTNEPATGSITKLYVTDDSGKEHVRPIDTFTLSGNTITATLADVLGAGNTATPPTTVRVLAYYTYESVEEAETITISSDKYSGYYKVVGDTLWRNEATGKDELVQFVAPKVKITSAFTISMQAEGEPSVFDFNLDVFKDSNSTDMVKFIRYTK